MQPKGEHDTDINVLNTPNSISETLKMPTFQSKITFDTNSQTSLINNCLLYLALSTA